MFDATDSIVATSRIKDFRKISDEMGKISFSSSSHTKSGHPLRGISAKVLRGFGKIGILSWLTGYRYVLAPTSIYMIGVLPEHPYE
jgi:hypothetical protein